MDENEIQQKILLHFFFHISLAGQRLALIEEKLVVAYVLHHFNIKSVQSFEELRPCSELILRPKDGILVTLTKRQSAKEVKGCQKK